MTEMLRDDFRYNPEGEPGIVDLFYKVDLIIRVHAPTGKIEMVRVGGAESLIEPECISNDSVQIPAEVGKAIEVATEAVWPDWTMRDGDPVKEVRDEMKKKIISQPDQAVLIPNRVLRSWFHKLERDAGS